MEHFVKKRLADYVICNIGHYEDDPVEALVQLGKTSFPDLYELSNCGGNAGHRRRTPQAHVAPPPATGEVFLREFVGPQRRGVALHLHPGLEIRHVHGQVHPRS